MMVLLYQKYCIFARFFIHLSAALLYKSFALGGIINSRAFLSTPPEAGRCEAPAV